MIEKNSSFIQYMPYVNIELKFPDGYKSKAIDDEIFLLLLREVLGWGGPYVASPTPGHGAGVALMWPDLPQAPGLVWPFCDQPPPWPRGWCGLHMASPSRPWGRCGPYVANPSVSWLVWPSCCQYPGPWTGVALMWLTFLPPSCFGPHMASHSRPVGWCGPHVTSSPPPPARGLVQPSGSLWASVTLMRPTPPARGLCVAFYVASPHATKLVWPSCGQSLG